MSTITSSTAGDQRTNNNSRLIARTRCILALMALLTIFIDPNEPDRYAPATYICLILYCLFSFSILLLVSFNKTFVIPAFNNPYWLDVAWYLLLISLSSGTNSIFFFFFYFAILNSSFSRGFKTGFLVTVTAALGFSVVGYLAATQPDEFETNRFLLRPLTLLALGYMIARWGGAQTRSVRRMDLLKEIGIISNPRFGVDRTIAVNLDLIRRFFRAESCFLITIEHDPEQYSIRLSDRLSPEGALKSKSLDAALGEPFISLPGKYAFAMETGKLAALFREKKLDVFDTSEKVFLKVADAPYRELAEKLGARSFITAPVFRHGEANGRLYVTSDRSFVFDHSDVEFLVQAIDHFTPIVENIRLVDRLASDAAESERLKIARDIHDSVVQPYVGLQMGIASLVQLVGKDGDKAGRETETIELVRDRVGRLQDLTDEGIDDLRSYIRGLSDEGDREASLILSIRSYAEKFSDATGIRVRTDLPQNLQIPDRLAAELFQLIAEALSNVRRHTSSPEATVRVRIDDSTLAVSVINVTDGPGFEAFHPRSIYERTVSLGGSMRSASVDQNTEVSIEIPL